MKPAFFFGAVILACGIAAAILACSAASRRTWSLDEVTEPPFCECVLSDLPVLLRGGAAVVRAFAAGVGGATST